MAKDRGRPRILPTDSRHLNARLPGKTYRWLERRAEEELISIACVARRVFDSAMEAEKGGGA